MSERVVLGGAVGRALDSQPLRTLLPLQRYRVPIPPESQNPNIFWTTCWGNEMQSPVRAHPIIIGTMMVQIRNNTNMSSEVASHKVHASRSRPMLPSIKAIFLLKFSMELILLYNTKFLRH